MHRTMEHRRLSGALSAFAAAAMAISVAPAEADETIECASADYRHTSCPIADRKHGYVRLDQNLSDTNCVQGQNWDFDERQIWVDDGCRGRFIVESRDSDNSGAITAAAIIGALAVGAIVAANDDDHDHRDKNYYGGHTSYVPPWMIGDFEGYNPKYRKQVHLTIKGDGRATARSSAGTVKGYVNNNYLYVGDHEFAISRAGDGLSTTELGDRSNRVYYSREGGWSNGSGSGRDYGYEYNSPPEVVMGRNGEGEVIFTSNNCIVYYNARGARKSKSNACSRSQGDRADDAMRRYRREQGY